jgi:hypothetical protein
LREVCYSHPDRGQDQLHLEVMGYMFCGTYTSSVLFK